MTNQERIQGYSTKELAEWIYDIIREGEQCLDEDGWAKWLTETSEE